MLTWFPAVLSSSKIFPYFHQLITFLYSCITMHLSYTRYALSGKWMSVVCMLYSALTYDSAEHEGRWWWWWFQIPLSEMGFHF